MSGFAPLKATDPNQPERKMVSLRLTQTARQLLRQQAGEQGVSQSAIVERLLRKTCALPSAYLVKEG